MLPLLVLKEAVGRNRGGRRGDSPSSVPVEPREYAGLLTRSHTVAGSLEEAEFLSGVFSYISWCRRVVRTGFSKEGCCCAATLALESKPRLRVSASVTSLNENSGPLTSK